jgi:hypothetical protein
MGSLTSSYIYNRSQLNPFRVNFIINSIPRRRNRDA